MGLSVIVPVYNGEKYIEECLTSIINQTYKELQIIVVNDGSKDGTKDIVEKISKKDRRVLLINKNNGGVSSARNMGLAYTTQDFVTFVDADDTLELDMYQILMEYIKKINVDIVHCGYKKMCRNECFKVVNGTGNIFIQSTEEALECIISGKLFVGSLWNKIYKTQLFENIRFDETLKINEDILINYYLFKKSTKSVFIDIPKYNYWKRETSTCRSIDNIKRITDAAKVSLLIYEDCKGTNLEYIALNRYYYTLIVMYRTYYYDKKIDKIERRNNIKYLQKNIKSILKTNLIRNIRNILLGILICYLPNIYGLVYKIYDTIRVPNWDVK